MPDETILGQKNKGSAIGQYPYFAPDAVGMRKAPKMTKADELYLKKFIAARENLVIVNAAQKLLDEKMLREEAKAEEPFEDGKVNIQINNRLYLERNKNKADNAYYVAPNGEKVTLTNQIFGEHRYF